MNETGLQKTTKTFVLYKLVNSKWEVEETLEGTRKELARKLHKEEKPGTWKLRHRIN